MWEQIVETIETIMNYPVVIAGVSVGTLGAIVLSVVAKTSLGKKSINTLKDKFASFTNEILTFKGSVEIIKAELIQKQNDFIEFSKKQIAIIEEEKNELQELLVVIAENTNNVKVKQALTDFNKKIELREIEAQEKIEAAKTQLLTYREQMDKEYNEIIEKLQNRVKELEHEEENIETEEE